MPYIKEAVGDDVETAVVQLADGRTYEYVAGIDTTNPHLDGMRSKGEGPGFGASPALDGGPCGHHSAHRWLLGIPLEQPPALAAPLARRLRMIPSRIPVHRAQWPTW